MSDLKIKTLQENIKVNFNNQSLLRKAMTHRSFLNENKDLDHESNERLEFLGDAVLSLIVSDYIFLENKNYQEGDLTNLRSLIVRSKTLAVAAKKLDLGTYLLLSKGEVQSGGRQNESLLANSYEALLGAIYLDQGQKIATEFVKRTLLGILKTITTDGELYDYKSRLQQKIQEKYHLLPTYKIISESGPDHQKQFKVGVFINNKKLGSGTGKNKQEAEQHAAKTALESNSLK